MKCSHARKLMGAYLYGDLQPDEMREVRLHVNDCPTCREDLHNRGAVLSSIGDELPELSEAERQRIAWMVEGAVKRDAEHSRQVFRAVLTFGGVSAFAAALVVAGVLCTRPWNGRAKVMRAEKKRTPAIVTVKISEEPVKSTTNDKSTRARKPEVGYFESDALQVISDAVGRAVRQGGIAVSRHVPRRSRAAPAAVDKPVEDVTPVEDVHYEVQSTPTKLPEINGPNDARLVSSDEEKE